MENSQALKNSLKINSPTFYSLSDSVLNISRFNKVELDWSSIVENIDTQEYLRDYFLSHSFIEVTGGTKVNECQGKEKFWDFFPYRYKDGENEINKEIFCITLNYPRRLYVVGTKDDYQKKSDIVPFLEKSIDDLWEKFEEQDYDYFLTYFDSEAKTLTFDKSPRKELVSRELLFYKEKFEHLSAKLKFIQQVNNKINSEFTSNILSEQENLQKLFGDSDLLSFYLSNYSRINLIEIDLKNEIDIIQNKLFEKGYFLETEKCENGCARKQWGLEFKSNYGEIYSLAKTEVDHEIITYVDKEVYDYSSPNRPPSGRGKDGKPIKQANGEAAWEFDGTKTKIIKEKVVRFEKRNEEQIKPVPIKDDPIYEKILKLKEKGYWVLVFENRDGSYFSNSSSLLSEIVESCESSEETRINTVIVIKEYDFVDPTNKAVISATFYYHPMRGVIPSKLPTIGIRETLDYRMSWAGLEVGKLIDSICLAPGETKIVSISSKFSSINSTTASTKTFNEISSVDSDEFSTEFEKLVTNELEKVRESSSSLSAGASYGGFIKADGEMKQSSKETIKDFTKNLNRSTTKATNTLSKKASVEVSFSSSTSVENTSTSTRNSTISNINQGRTLNLYYYQLNNRFLSRVYLENLRLEISSSLELIEGSGIYDKFVTKLSNIERVISLTKQFIPHLKDGDENKNLRVIIESIIRTLNEYTNLPLLIESEDKREIAKLNSLKIIKIQNQFAEKFNHPINYEQLIDAYKLLISSIQFEDLYYNPETFIIDSGSYYLDSQVGVNPATEEYSEKMRELEAVKISTEIKKQIALTDEVKAKNQLLNINSPYIKEIVVLKKAEATESFASTIILNLSTKINDSDWTVYIKNLNIGNLTMSLTNQDTSLVIEGLGELPGKEELESELLLLHNTTKAILRFI